MEVKLIDRMIQRQVLSQMEKLDEETIAQVIKALLQDDTEQSENLH